jgi:hypothetical protein
VDGGKGRTAKVFSIDRRDLWIEALLPAEEGLPEPDPISFQIESIDYVRAVGPRHSSIRLKSGTEFFFTLPQPALQSMLRAPEEPVLDLKPYVCFEKKNALLGRLRELFKEEAEAAKYAPVENLSFRAFVRIAGQADFREFNFSGRDINARNIAEGGSIMGGQNLRFTLKDASRSPFPGVSEVLMEGTLAEFNALCGEAYRRGHKVLDLSDYSMRKGTLTAEERARRTSPPGPQP